MQYNSAESLENKNVKCHPQCHLNFTNDTKLNKILKQQTKEKEESSTEITAEQQ